MTTHITLYNWLFELSPLRIVEHYNKLMMIQKLSVLRKKSAKSVINSDKAVALTP